jgi:protein SCO1
MIKIGLFVSIIGLFIACSQSGKSNNHPRQLPYLGNYEVIYGKNGEANDTVYPTIPSFKFLNQDSTEVTEKNYQGKIWIVEFFFTKCPTICPIMNRQLERLHKALSPKAHSKIQFLSFSIDPQNDGPKTLKEYQKRTGIDYDNWDLLTGDETFTHNLGIQHFLTFAGKEEDAAGGYAHSGSFTLVDRKGYVRGVYAVTNPDLSVNEQEYLRMVNDVNLLIHENP